ncbi:glycerol 3-phosphate dehydrogenase (NAD(P)+) [Granulicatella balaenopterae]|uniref:Glycerol-3-phosphate dehydrogenase [NAD(P)+] n=1 Tax=Granulicatella balaenopterae TaxID=137733 RepID=A0A1H9NM42_9LACT|nr:NAD(P)H-dependent glycerol-3-phosphate dehydrogenase [Granulicatella balaenopterae]SER36715.1 glycerol 3-phosphate dehydrogenase (NAD(P)+) [Granulicatella balaenopterae]
MKQKIAVLGSGSWGTALASVLDSNHHEARLWGNVPEQIEEINTKHTNKHYLPEFVLADSIKAYSDLEEVLCDVDAIVFVLPTKAIRVVAHQVSEVLDRTNPSKKPMIIHASKGLEQESHKRISVILAEELPSDQIQDVVVLSGPSHAEEVVKQDITTITAACSDLDSAKYVQNLFSNGFFRIYTNQDVIGVELGAALKNVIAVGAGALHGLGYGDNAKAALMTRGLTEISRLGVAFGADPLTFIGLSGVGDLIVTCTSVHSRNWRCGNQLGQGVPIEDVLENMGMVVEGVATTKAAYELAAQKGIDMPITTAIYRVIYQNEDLKTEISDLMKRERKSEASLKSIEK